MNCFKGIKFHPFLLSAVLCVGACQQPPGASAPMAFKVSQGVGYLVLNAPILPATRDLFISNIEKFRAAGANEIDLGLNSPGGDIDSAQAMVDYMARAHDQDHIRFKAVNVGLVGSAASYLFLNAQDRYTLPKSTFIFHAAGYVGALPATAETLRENADKLDAYERVVRAALKAHTTISDSQATVYVRRTVVLNADDARRDGVVDGVLPAYAPNGTPIVVISGKPRAPAPSSPAANPAS